jgi:hypothetical protein
MCTGNGQAHFENALRGKRIEVPMKILSWPRQQCPPAKVWTIWQTFVKKAFLSRGLWLINVMGQWARVEEA